MAKQDLDHRRFVMNLVPNEVSDRGAARQIALRGNSEAPDCCAGVGRRH
jgi:hypothetical protein